MGSHVSQRLTNHVTYVDPDTGRSRVGHLDLTTKSIQPLSFASGTPVADLYQVIEANGQGVAIQAAGQSLAAGSVSVLPPFTGRDILAVGKNYMEHAREFNNSGFDSSDKVARPSHPVIFTKRATSIVADGAAIVLRDDNGFTSTLDYEGELGVIVGKAGHAVSQEQAWDHVWGYTIINDVTARERQRDHKQFFLGKSGDTYCPMGPVAVPKEDLPKVLRVQTHVNGELRQNATTDDLIFSIPELIATISTGQTLQPGDVLATGTPAGVGIGRNPPIYLEPGDEVVVSIEGLGALHNRVTKPAKGQSLVEPISAFTATNADRFPGGKAVLTDFDGKLLYYQRRGSDSPASQPFLFVHGLGGSQDYWTPLVAGLSGRENASFHLFDWEGHGLSPTHPLSSISTASLAQDIASVARHAGISAARPAVLFAHSMGNLAAVRFALDNPSLVRQLVLVGPPPSPLPAAAAEASLARAALVRSKGMTAVADAVVAAGTSANTKQANPLAVAAVRLSLLAQDPESYAKGCQALAGSAAETLPVENLKVPTLIITGDEDKVSPPALCDKYKGRLAQAEVVVLPQVGHWHVFEDVTGVTKAVKAFL